MPTPDSNPYCSACGYDLTGAVDSSKCPECGRPLVETLMRPVLEHSGGKRYTSKARILGLPVVAIAVGPHGKERIGRPRGFIAIGDEAKGVLAIGGRATGVVAIGGMAMGGFSMGGMSIGLVTSAGGMAIGGLVAGGMAVGGLAQGGGAIGVLAQGGLAIGWFARGGGAFGKHTMGGNGATGSSGAVDAAFRGFDWFFGGWPPTAASMLGAFGSVFILVVLAAVAVGLVALLAVRHDASGNPHVQG